MSPASYRAAPPRVDSLTLAQPTTRLQNGPRTTGGPPENQRATSQNSYAQPLGVGAGLAGPDGFTDGPTVGAALALAAFWAFWKLVIATSSCCSA